MTRLDDHPSVVRFRQSEPRPHPGRIDVERLRRICLDAGADDVGFVAIDRHELDDQRAEILGLYPWTKGLISLVCRMNREPIRSAARSVANLEFHHVGDHTNEVASKIVSALEAEGVRSTQGAGRARDLEATDSGRALIRAVLPAWDGAQERARRVLGAAVTGGSSRR
jgi:hypothetical protein